MILHRKYDVLIVLDHYLPGRLAGGPVTTIANLVARMGEHFRFLIVTRNYDLNGDVYTDVPVGVVVELGKADVIYLAKDNFNPAILEEISNRYHIPIIYLNSFFSQSAIKILIAHRFGSIRRRIILAPRGEFSKGALKLKALKKMAYLTLFRVLRLDRQVEIFQASSHFENVDIWRTLGPVPVHIAPDMPAPVNDAPLRQKNTVSPRMVFISRISPKKNLAYAIKVMQSLDIPAVLDIYGPHEDLEYWQYCEKLISQSPPHISINDCGTLRHQEIASTFSRYAGFIFPTLGENYGHVIIEALAAGCPVIVSEQTPWQDLALRGVGWVLPLSAPDEYARAIKQLLSESPEDRQSRSELCRQYAEAVAADPTILADNEDLFRRSNYRNEDKW